jgi:glycosyltransferase involved in cell wall biosynthesis
VRLKLIAILFLFFYFITDAAPKISVIIPVYNSAQFLPSCLESVINQTLKDIEIICINDGSTDNSLFVLQEYARRDSRIKIFSQPNRGVSAARNVGLKIAIGEYICFIDSDDTADLNMLKKLYEVIIKYECDVALCDVKNISGRSDDVSRGKHMLITEEYLRKPARNMLILVCWNKIYKKSAIGNIKFNEQISSCEDSNFNLQFFHKYKKSVFLAEKLYIYNGGNQNSLSRSEGSQLKAVQSLCTVIKDLYQRIGNTLEEKDNLKENVLNDLAMEILCLSCRNISNIPEAVRKINEFYCDKIIDLNMESRSKMLALSAIMLGKAIEFVEGLRNALF